VECDNGGYIIVIMIDRPSFLFNIEDDDDVPVSHFAGRSSGSGNPETPLVIKDMLSL